MSYYNYPSSCSQGQAPSYQHHPQDRGGGSQQQRRTDRDEVTMARQSATMNSQPQQMPQSQYTPSDAQQYVTWNYQQNMMRYPVQPPTYPPPAYAYPQQYHSYPTPPTGAGYYGYPQAPAPAAVMAYQNRKVTPSYPQPSAPPPPALAASASLPMTEGYPSEPLKQEPVATESKESKKQPIVVGKRRGGRVLPTGVVKKQKTESTAEQGRKDPWSQYLHEVKRYKETSCEDDSVRKNRPLVK